jgi:predicted dithiol-disulfide oxidoreductase (DUF899 family)
MLPGRLETESPAHRQLRDELLAAEIALKDRRERVAALRRGLPLNTGIQDYELHEGPPDLAKDGPFPMVRLSGLFDDPQKQDINFAIIAQAGIREFREWGRERNWHSLRLVSCEGTDFKTVLNYQDAEGKQRPGLSVLKLSPDGSVKHFYSSSPLWNLLDLTPDGRGQWNPKLKY